VCVERREAGQGWLQCWCGSPEAHLVNAGSLLWLEQLMMSVVGVFRKTGVGQGGLLCWCQAVTMPTCTTWGRWASPGWATLGGSECHVLLC
jgi:hypothetical protein